MQIKANYDSLIPNYVLFNLAELQELNILKTPTAKKLIYAGKIEAIKIGNKLHISRAEIIRYLEDRTIKVEVA
ncbi:helix-turn-helix domain-containing protein [Aliarcobacter butzleri]|uniref:helix-turn-helix domain-containing protein n=1 Tax=Aliarcobacter butzleri TaxID=28197 RepID=UPI001EDD6B3F|nr:helix-turn-helix domain-containing protein [Aliarcobacter butzleri]MCG3703079.1 helix-turn-helix domain-containing protein [Aliarcobacter butzleri]MDN5128804.1 helix-turn-helix domain-containing protein [Aliarcobacter butzleri]